MATAIIEAAAMDDLEDIVACRLRVGGGSSARRFSDKFFEAAAALERFPEMGSPDPDQFLAARGYRRISIEDHWCYYVIADESVRIRRVLRKGKLRGMLP